MNEVGGIHRCCVSSKILEPYNENEVVKEVYFTLSFELGRLSIHVFSMYMKFKPTCVSKQRLITKYGFFLTYHQTSLTTLPF